MNDAAPRDRSSWADLGAPTHYVDLPPAGAGDGVPVVLVHGLAGSHANWVRVAPRLAARGHYVYVPDLPGHGLTRAQGHDTSLEGLTLLLERFLRTVVGGPAVVVGNSLGGLLGAFHAARHPDTVRALALVAPAVPPGRARLHPVTAAAFAGYLLPGVGEALVGVRHRHVRPQDAVSAAMRVVCADPSQVPDDVVQRHVEVLRARAGYRQVEAAFLRSTRTLVRSLLRPAQVHAALDAVACPVLHVHGTQDRLVPVAAARAAARARPHWQYVEVPGGGHLPQLDAPDVLLAALEPWLGRTLGDAPGPAHRATADPGD